MAAQDPRFSPLISTELAEICIEISLLSPFARMHDIHELQLGLHGVVVEYGAHRGVFLPKVATEMGWGREALLSHVCSEKAGLASDAWQQPDVMVYLFTVDIISDLSS